MKNIRILTTLFALLLLVSCGEEYADHTAPDELSDVSWIISLQQFAQEPYNIKADTHLSFFDLSQGDVSHEWIIEEGNSYLKEGFSTTDSLPLFINNDAGLSITNDKAHVLFRNNGLNTVRLLNKFNTPVNINFSEEYLNSDNIEVDLYQENNLHVVDAKFIFDVYGKLKPAFKVFQDGVEILSVTEDDMPSIDDMDSWPTVDVEAGAGLTFVDLTTEDRPNNRQWLYADGVPNSTNQEEALIKFFSLGTYTGSMRSMRLAPLPTDSETKLIPLKVHVIPSSQPFVYDGALKEAENEKISFRVTGEAAPFSGEEGNFTVHVTNATSGFDMNIPVLNAQVSSDNATLIELTLSQPIYNTDQITVSYSGGGGITSTDTRVLQAFGPETVQMYFAGNILPANGWASYEIAHDASNRAKCAGYWVGNNNITADGLIYERVADRFYNGSWSMRFNSSAADPIPNLNLAGYNLARPQPVPAGTYRVSYWLFLEQGNTIKNFRTILLVPSDGTAYQEHLWNIENLVRGEWVKVSKTMTFANELPTDGADNATTRWTFRINSDDNIGVTGAQTMYIDDLSLIELEQRP